MRAALLPAGPDPFLLTDWLRHFERWQSEVDVLHVLVCGLADPEAQAHLEREASRLRNATLHFRETRLDHGRALRQLVTEHGTDTVVLCEDDAYVRKPGVVSEAFAQVERGDVDIVGSPRGSVSDEVAQAAQARFGGPVSVQSGESGNSLWPCFLFARRDTLMLADDFSAHAYRADEYIPELRYTPKQTQAGDTFVHATYQLRDRDLRILWQPQYRVDADLMDRWLANDPPWFHVGSLSAGYGYLFLGPGDGSFERIAAQVKEQGAQHDWEKRMAWWRRSVRLTDTLPSQRGRFADEMERFTDLADLSRRNIDLWSQRFAGWVTW